MKRGFSFQLVSAAYYNGKRCFRTAGGRHWIQQCAAADDDKWKRTSLYFIYQKITVYPHINYSDHSGRSCDAACQGDYPCATLALLNKLSLYDDWSVQFRGFIAPCLFPLLSFLMVLAATCSFLTPALVALDWMQAITWQYHPAAMAR